MLFDGQGHERYNTLPLNRWRGARAVYGSGLENRRACKRTVGSNPTLSVDLSTREARIDSIRASFFERMSELANIVSTQLTIAYRQAAEGANRIEKTSLGEDTGLQVSNDGAEFSRREQPGSQGSGRVLANGRQGSQRSAHFWRHVLKLPVDLILDGFWPVRICKAGGSRSIGGSAERVSAHVADSDRLTGGSGGGACRRSLHLARTDATGKAPANLLGSAQLSAGERA